MKEDNYIDISELVPDTKNFNRHTEYGMGLLEKSVSKFGMGRSILIDKDNNIIAGNGITETAMNVGIDRVRVVETDGNEIIAVKRNDISLDTPQGREMALADNATNAANLRWENETLKKAEEEYGIRKEDWGIEFSRAQKLLERERENEVEIEEFPITILRNKEEYRMFNKIMETLGLGSNAETFAFILNEFYSKHYGNNN